MSFSLAQIARRRPTSAVPVVVEIEDAELFALALAVGVLTQRATTVRAA